MKSTQIRNTLLLVLTALIWGSAFVAQSVGAEHVGAFTFLAIRSWIAGAALIPVTAIIDAIGKKCGTAPRAPQTAEDKKTLLTAGICCGLLLFSASAVQQFGMAYTTTAKGGFLTALYIIIVPIISVFLGRKIGLKIWICVALSFIGLYLLCMKDGFSLKLGDTLVLLCALLFSGHILAVDRFSPKVDGVRLSCIQFFITAIISTVCMFIFEKPDIDGIIAAGIPILYAGLLSSGVGYTLQIIGQKGLDPTVAGLAMSLESVFSALAGWLLLNQKLSVREFAGCAIMFAAIILAQLPIKKARGEMTA